MRPRLKPLRTIRDADSLRLIREPGVFFDIEDPGGQVTGLLSRLDGNRTVSEIHGSLVADWPDLSAEDVAGAIKALDESGLLMDADVAVPARESDRYASNLAFLTSFATLEISEYELHQRLRRAHVVLLGVGGLGSTLLLSLAGAGVGRLTLLDNDRVERKNLARQFLYTEADVGQPKVERARARALAVNPTLRVDTVERWVRQPQDVLPLLDGADLVVCGIDRPADVRRIVGRACVAAGVPFLSGGMWATRGSYYGFDPGRGGCLDCWGLQNVKSGKPVGSFPAATANRAMGPMAAVIGGLIGLEAIRLLTGYAPPVSLGKAWIIDFVTGAVSVFNEWHQQPDCPTCGHSGAPTSS